MHPIRFAILLLFAAVHLVHGESPAIISSTPDREENLGGSVELTCTFRNIGNLPVQWLKIDKDRAREPISLFVSDVAIIPDPRFSSRSDRQNGVYTLLVRNITDTDAGYYKCSVVLSMETQLHREIQLQVKYPPVIYDNSTSTVVVPLNGSTKLECFVAGHPNPRVVWSRENNALLPTGELSYVGNALRLPSVGREHAGVYYCSADNQVGTSVKKAIRLVVEFAPQVQVARPRVGQALNFNAELECRVAAEPTPLIMWKVNGSQVPSNQHYRVAYHATATEYNASVLHITSVQRFQYGVYTCEASNKLGRNLATVELYETEEQECSPTCGSHFWYADLRLVATTSSAAVLFALVRW